MCISTKRNVLCQAVKHNTKEGGGFISDIFYVMLHCDFLHVKILGLLEAIILNVPVQILY